MAFNKARALQEADKSVIQGKIPQAIKQYLEIIERDPSDLTLLNTVGDLYVRQKNIPEALKHFRRLADGYVQEGFTVKAIAIFKKISKLDPNSVDWLLRLAELYRIQGLGREARENYAQAVEFFRKKKQNDQALEVLNKIIALDPENVANRLRLGEFCEQTGRRAEAARAYAEAAETALRRGDLAAAEPALKKASELDAKNLQVILLRARLALSQGQPAEAEKILTSVSGLAVQPAARQLLLEAYLATLQLEAAEKLVVDVYRSEPANFDPVSSFCRLCVEKGNPDAALKPLSVLADELIEKGNGGPLMDVLRKLWSRNPQHIPALELICRICERSADELTLPEAVEALGAAYVQAGELEKAEKVYRQLLEREPENQQYEDLMKQVLQKQGKEYVPPSPAELSAAEIALSPEQEADAAAVSTAAVDAEQAAMVKEALENSDLFARYNLADKAVAELEKVLAVYPDQIEIHTRIVEVCHRNQPARAGQAAAALARIYTQRGEQASAKKYGDAARQYGVPAAVGEPTQPPVGVEIAVPLAPPPSEAAPAEIDLSQEFPLIAEEMTPARQPQEVSFGPPTTLAVPPPTAAEAHELDLSADWMAATAAPQAPAVEEEVPAFNYEESRTEIDFYLAQGFVEEAHRTVEALEQEFPGNALVAELRQRVEAQVPAQAVLEAPAPRPVEAETEPVAPAPKLAPAVPEVPPPAEVEAWELPTTFAQPAAAEIPLAAGAPGPPELPESVSTATPPAAPEPVPLAPGDMLGSLASDFAASFEGFGAPALPTPQAPAAAGAAAGPVGSPLSDLLEELGEPAEAATKEDAETHYSLGVAFREMGLLDEAIGEFQKVVKGAGKGTFPPHYLQACTLLATCFKDKSMPAIAAKWYLRGLETPDLDEEATLALQYDLGVAYEQAGDTRNALERFTEVYSQNIDYRDVAEKIRVLQQKPS
jgi:tetratricopeptide (TPR) repeat protein